MPYQDLGERMDRLETAVTNFVRRTDDSFARHDIIISELHQMAGRMDASRLHADQQLADLTSKVAVVAEDIAEMREWRIQAQKQWGEIAQKLGSFVEDIVAPNIPHLGRDAFQLGTEQDEDLIRNDCEQMEFESKLEAGIDGPFAPLESDWKEQVREAAKTRGKSHPRTRFGKNWTGDAREDGKPQEKSDVGNTRVQDLALADEERAAAESPIWDQCAVRSKGRV